MAQLLGAKIGNFHTLTDWGLYLKVGSPKIGAAEPEEYLVQVTGSDSLLNLTTWDDGKVHYKNAHHHHGAALQRAKKASGLTSKAPLPMPFMASGCSAALMKTRRGTGKGFGKSHHPATGFPAPLPSPAPATPSSAASTTAPTTGCGTISTLSMILCATTRISRSRQTRTFKCP